MGPVPLLWSVYLLCIYKQQRFEKVGIRHMGLVCIISFFNYVGSFSDCSTAQASIRCTCNNREHNIMSCLIYIEKLYWYIWPKRPTLKSGRNDSGRNDPAKTTHSQNDSCPKRLTSETTHVRNDSRPN